MACKESHSVILSDYSRIFLEGSTPTWFSFNKDFLYLNWGTRIGVCSYFPWDFERFQWTDDVNHIVHEDGARKVKNLVVLKPVIIRGYMSWRHKTEEEFLMRDVLNVFTGVENLVLADEYHRRDEQGEELAWLEGDLRDDVMTFREGEGWDSDGFWKSKSRDFLRGLILWRDILEYGHGVEVCLIEMQKQWDKVAAVGRKMPRITRKAVVTASTKKSLLDICKSEENFWKLQGLDWEFVEDGHTYHGQLDYSQQFAFLKLALERTFCDYEEDYVGCEIYGMCTWDVPILLARMDTLMEEAAYSHEVEEWMLKEAGDVI